MGFFLLFAYEKSWSAWGHTLFAYYKNKLRLILCSWHTSKNAIPEYVIISQCDVLFFLFFSFIVSMIIQQETLQCSKKNIVSYD